METDNPAAKERGRQGRGAWALRLVWLCCAAALLAAPPPSAGAEEAGQDLAIVAKFVYQLTKYVSWPEAAHATPADPIVIGVVDDELLAETILAIVANKSVRGRPIEVVPLRDAADASVHLLFVPEAGRAALRRIARRYQDGLVLTVADEFDFPELGGDVGIELVGGRISFSINRRKVTRGEFNISSKLMRLASEVK